MQRGYPVNTWGDGTHTCTQAGIRLCEAPPSPRSLWLDPGHGLLHHPHHVKAGAVPPVTATPSPSTGPCSKLALKPEHTGSS